MWIGARFQGVETLNDRQLNVIAGLAAWAMAIVHVLQSERQNCFLFLVSFCFV